MRPISLFLYLSMALPGHQVAWSATLKGTVSDSLTLAAIESVLVTVKGTATSAYTDQQGVFSLDYQTGIRDRGPRTTENAPVRTAGVFSLDGRRIAERDAAPLSAPDGIYLVRLADGSLQKIVYAGDRRTITGAITAAAAKTATTAVLEFSHKYYTGKEAAVNVPDTSVGARLSMWFPDTATTGVPAGTALQPSSGLLRVNTADTVIEGLDHDGSIVIFADNVTIRQCHVYGTSEGSLININWGYGGYKNIVIEDCDLENHGGGPTIIISDGIVRRCHIHNLGSDGLFLGSHAVVEDSYVHGFLELTGAHNDGIQTTGGTDLTIRHNRVENGLSQTSCVFLEHYGANLDSITVELNSFDGGGYTIYGGGDNATYTSANIHILNNRFGKKFHPTCGYYGFCAYYNPTLPGNQWAGNVWLTTGAPVNP